MAHRNISPFNIFVRGRSEIYNNINVILLNFGLFKENSDFITFCGTFIYQIPEVIYPIKPKPGISFNYKKRTNIFVPSTCGILALSSFK